MQGAHTSSEMSAIVAIIDMVLSLKEVHKPCMYVCMYVRVTVCAYACVSAIVAIIDMGLSLKDVHEPCIYVCVRVHIHTYIDTYIYK
jgi:hypothetical protein